MSYTVLDGCTSLTSPNTWSAPIGGTLSVEDVTVPQFLDDNGKAIQVTFPTNTSGKTMRCTLGTPVTIANGFFYIVVRSVTSMSSANGGFIGYANTAPATDTAASTWDSTKSRITSDWCLYGPFARTDIGGGVYKGTFATQSGTPDLDDPIEVIDFRFNQSPSIPQTIQVAAVLYAMESRPRISVVVDDGLASTGTFIGPAAVANGFRINSAITHDGNGIDAGGFMTNTQVIALHAAGHACVVHAVKSFTDDGGEFATQGDLEDYIEAAYDYCAGIDSAGAKHMIYVGGAGYYVKGDSVVTDKMASLGMTAGYTINAGAFPMAAGMIDRDYVHRADMGTGSHTSIASALVEIDGAINTGQSIILTLHDAVESSPTGNAQTEAIITGIFEGIAARRDAGLVDIMTLPELETLWNDPNGVLGGLALTGPLTSDLTSDLTSGLTG